MNKIILMILLLIMINNNNIYTYGVDIRVGIVDWTSVDGTGKIWDGLVTQAVTSQFILASYHFNERRSDLIPELESIKNCNKNISIVRFCDTAGNMRRSSDTTLYMLKNYNLHAIGKFLFILVKKLKMNTFFSL